jgi:hypothetical protein
MIGDEVYVNEFISVSEYGQSDRVFFHPEMPKYIYGWWDGGTSYILVRDI